MLSAAPVPFSLNALVHLGCHSEPFATAVFGIFLVLVSRSVRKVSLLFGAGKVGVADASASAYVPGEPADLIGSIAQSSNSIIAPIPQTDSGKLTSMHVY